MPNFDVKNYLETYYGPAGKSNHINDNKLKEGLGYIVSRMLANCILAGDSKYDLCMDGAEILLQQEHENIKQVLITNYNVNDLDDYKFFLGDGTIFYNSQEGRVLLNDVAALTGCGDRADLNLNRLVFTVATDMMNYYYKSGACMYKASSADAHKYDMFVYHPEHVSDFFLNEDGSPILTEAERKHLLALRSRLMDEYPTKEMLKQAYRESLTNPGTHFDTNLLSRLTKEDKKEIAENVDVDDIVKKAERRINKILNIGEVNEDAKRFAYRYKSGELAHEPYNNYKMFCIERIVNPDSLDKENIAKLIKVAHNLQDLHESRSKWDRFVGFFGGACGAERTTINSIRDYIVAHAEGNITKSMVQKAIDGDANSLNSILSQAKTKEDRVLFDSEMEHAKMTTALQFTGITDISMAEDYVTVNNVALAKQDITYFTKNIHVTDTKEAEEEFKEGEEDANISKDFEDFKNENLDFEVNSPDLDEELTSTDARGIEDVLDAPFDFDSVEHPVRESSVKEMEPTEKFEDTPVKENILNNTLGK